MSQVSKKPIGLPVRKRIKPTVNLNVACRRRKDAKDLPTSTDATVEVQEVETKNLSSLAGTQEDNGSLPFARDKANEISNAHFSAKQNENILNTSFESKLSISSSVSTILLQNNARTDSTQEENNKSTLNESFESQDGPCRSITSSVSTVLLPAGQQKSIEKSHDMVVDQSIELEEELNGRDIIDTVVGNNSETTSHASERDGSVHDELSLTKDYPTKSVRTSTSQQNLRSRKRAKEQEKSSNTLPNDSENESVKSVLSGTPAGQHRDENTDSESVNDDRSSISEYSVIREGSDLSLPKYKRKISSMSKRLSEAKRSFEARYFDKKPERSSLRMLDLIYYNPSTNPMKATSEKPSEVVVNSPSEELDSSRRTEEDVDNPGEEEEGIDDDNDDGDNDNGDNDGGIPAPRVKVGPNGEIVLDEQSLVIETTQSKKSRQEIANLTVVVDTGSSTTYHTYSKKKRIRTDWTVKETIRFYKALQTLGTDFSLMQTLFPSRSRLDLKSKFKKEERINGDLIEKALRFPSLFDISELEKDQTNEENKKTRTQKRKVSQKKPRKRSLKSLGFDEEDNGPSLKKKKRSRGSQVKTLSQRNRDNVIGKEPAEGEHHTSSSDEEYQLPAREQQEQSASSKEAPERRSSRIVRGINGHPPNYAALENKHDFLEAGVDLLESSEAEEENEPQENSETHSESVPVVPSSLSMNNVQPGSLVIVTAQCPNNPGYQICNVFMVQERSDNTDENVSPSTITNYFSTPSNVLGISTENMESESEPS